MKNEDNNGLNQHIFQLEEELARLRVTVELAGSDGNARQIKVQLTEWREFWTKDLKDLEYD